MYSENSKITSKLKDVEPKCNVEHFVQCCCHEWADPGNKKVWFYFLNFSGISVFWSTLFCPSLYYFCSVAHQENSRAYLSMFIIVFPLLTYTHDRQQRGRDEGEWRGDADEYAQY